MGWENDSTIGNEMVNVSGQIVGSGTGERVPKSGTGTGWEASGQIVTREESGTGTVHLAVGRETREQKSVTGEVGKHRSGKEISQPFPYRPDHISRPDFYRAKVRLVKPGSVRIFGSVESLGMSHVGIPFRMIEFETTRTPLTS